MSNVPTNLIPTTITQLPEYDGTSTLGYFPYALNGRTFKVQFAALAQSGLVPDTRTVTAGAGLTGGGQLNNNITISLDPSNATPLSLGVAFAGSGVQAARDDHVHPAVNLTDTSETQGVLPLGRGGTGVALSPVVGAVIYASGSNLDQTTAGTAGQVLTSAGGLGAPYWTTVSGTGTVTSVAVSGGTTGLTTSGGPITGAGTITIGGTLNVANGGTGQTTYTDGQLLIGNTATSGLSKATLTAGSGITITNGNGSITIASTGGGSGTVTSVAATVPTGFSISGSPITTSGTLAITFTAGYSLPTTASQANWDTAYTDRLKWDGGSTGLVAATGRTSLGATTVGGNFFTLTNPSAITFPRINADNSVSTLDAAAFRTAIGAGTGDGTVTSVGVTAGTGISVSGSPITSSGSITVTNSAPMTYPTSGIAVSTGSAWGTSLTAPSGAIVGTTDTQTLTDKRVTPRVSTTTSSATPTINTDTVDVYGLTAQAVDITSFTTNLSGTPTDGQKLWIYIVGTAARAITWGASFEASTVALPTTTVSTNRLDVGFVWNAATSKWRCVGTA